MSGQYRNDTPVVNGSGGNGTDTGSGGSTATPENLWYDKQPLPLFSVYSNYTGNNPDCSIYDSHFNLVSKAQQSGNGYCRPHENEITHNFMQHLSTNANIGYAVFGSYGVKGTPMIQADGHQFLAISPNGSIAARNPEIGGTLLNNAGTIIGPEGYRQPMSLQQRSNKLWQTPRGAQTTKDVLVDFGKEPYANPSWSPNMASTVRGMCSYNANTDKLLIVEQIGNDIADYRAHVYHNSKRKLTGKSGELRKFILEAKNATEGADYTYFDFSLPQIGVAYIDGNRKLKVVLSNDNKIIICRFKSGVEVTLYYVDIPSTSSSTTSSAAAGSGNPAIQLGTAHPVFNSFDSSNGENYGMRHQVSWDNKWIAIYAPYYYYLTGMVGFVINLDDPVNWFYKLSYNTYDYGINVLPIDKSGFIFGIDVNADNKAGASFGTAHFSTPEELAHAPGTKVCFVNGAPLNKNDMVTFAYENGLLESAYTGTNYPCLAPVESWFK